MKWILKVKGGLTSESILTLVPLPKKGVKFTPWAKNLNKLFAVKSGKFKLSALGRDFASFLAMGPNSKCLLRLSYLLALTFCLFLTYPELHIKTFFRSSDSNYFFNEGERFHEYCDYDKLLICTMAEITQFCPKIISS